MRSIKAVKPYIYPNQLNFKDKAFKAWRTTLTDSVGEGRETYAAVEGRYPRLLHKLMFSWDMPTLWRGEARLCFVQPVSLYFDTFFTAINHEIIPFVWDCWPMYYDKMERWLRRHKVRTAIFTSRQELEAMKSRIPEVRFIWCPEAVETDDYNGGKQLKDRTIDLLEFGRSNEKVLGSAPLPDSGATGRRHVCTKAGGRFLYTEEELHGLMEDAKVTICLPRSMTQPEVAGGVETLTQRYWEAMLSRMVIAGHAPQELIDIVGYNPVVELESLPGRDGIEGLLSHIGDYQELVDRNRLAALMHGDWKERMGKVRSLIAAL